MRIVRGIAAFLVLLASVLLVPAALVVMGHYPAPADLRWQHLLTAPDDGTVLLWLVTGLGWIAWALFSVSMALEAARLLGGPVIRIPGLAWMQTISGSLLVAVLVMLGWSHQHVPEAPAPPSASGPAVVAHAAPVREGGGTAAAVSHSVPTAAPEAAPQELNEEPRTFPYTVQPGDDLWTLAEKFYGDGMEWRRIEELNADILAKDPHLLRSGWQLRLAVPPSPTTDAQPPHTEPAAPVDDDAANPATQAAPTRQAAPEQDSSATDPGDADRSIRAQALGGMSALLAAGVVGGLAHKRRQQLVSRPVGTRPVRAEASGARLRTAMAAEQRPDTLELVEWGVHMLAREGEMQDRQRQPAWIRLDRDQLEVVWRTGDTTRAGLDDIAADKAARPDEDPRHPWPTVITIGTEAEETYFIDLETWGRLSVATESATRATEVLTAITLDLLSMPWACQADIRVHGPDGGLVEAVGSPHVRPVDDLDALLGVWEHRAGLRRRFLTSAGVTPAALRRDDALVDAWAPQVLLLLSDVTVAQRRRIDALFADEPNPALVLITDHPGGELELVVDEDPLTAEITVPLPDEHSYTLQFNPPRVDHQARDALVTLHRDHAITAVEPAPWWDPPVSEYPPPTPIHPQPTPIHPQPIPEPTHSSEEAPPMSGEDPLTVSPPIDSEPDPQLLLIGPVELHGARGVVPSRAPKQCMEYCAWLLENPGRTSIEMGRAMMVADSTRRSNMSRLRTWLGNSPEGDPYLPDAYSGRIELHHGISSDWQEVVMLLGAGIPRTPDSALAAALELVRGAPMADAPPGAWIWAEELRLDIACTLRDVAYEYARRRLGLPARGGHHRDLVGPQLADPEHATQTDPVEEESRRTQLDDAKWALGRGLIVSPGDELLLRLMMIAEHRAGNSREVERLMLSLNRQARTLGVDLMEETVAVMQFVLEGRVRQRTRDTPERRWPQGA